MENRKNIIFSIILFTGVLLLATPIFAFAYGVQTHALLTQEIAKFANASFTGINLNADDQASMMKGAIDEDNGTRWLQHFYDPVHNRGLTFGNDKPVNPNLAFVGSAPLKSQWKSAKEWAMNTGLQAGGATLLSGIMGNYFGGSDDYSWDRAIYEYAWGDKKRGLESLGHVLHLIEDASVPDHTRNDPHPSLGKKLQEDISFLARPAIVEYLGNHNITNSSPYESFVTFGPGSVPIADTLKSKNKKPVMLSSLTNYFEGIAKYSNENFFSKDTILKNYNKPYLEEQTKIKQADGVIWIFGMHKINDQLINLVRISQEFDTKKGEFIDSYSLQDNDNLILSTYWSLLSQQAVLHGTGVVKLFFDEVAKEKQDKTLYNKNRSWAGRRIDGFKKTAFGAVSLLYGSSVKQRDLEDDAPQESLLLIAQPSVSSITQPSVSASPLVSPSATPISPVAPVISLSTPSPIPQASAQSVPAQSNIRTVSQQSSQSTSLSNTFASSGSGSFGSAQHSPSTRVATSNSTTSVSPSSSPTPSPSPSPSSAATTTSPTDIQPPSLIFAVTQCAASLSPDGCVLATTTVTLAWSSSDSDLANYTIECTANAIVCSGFSFASTTATSTIYTATIDSTTYVFTARAIDTSGNESVMQTISVDIWLRPVVINEIAWAGTGSSPTTSKDEWLELYNPTPKTISLANMALNSPTNNSFKINLAGTIPSRGYYLIERTNNDVITDITADLTASFGSGLSNTGEQLTLTLGSTTIDTTPGTSVCGGWCAGAASGQYYTMERYDPLVSGGNQTNWANWQNILQYGTNAEAQQIKGTPKHRNDVNYFINYSSDISTNKTLTKANSPYIVISQITIGSSATLTIEPGVVIKFKNAGSGLYANGIILAQGTATDPIIFTSFADDTYAGDTNQNATTTMPQAGDWGSLRLLKNGSIIDHAVVRYGGQDSEKANIKVKNASVNITNSTIEQSMFYGIVFENSIGTIAGNIIRSNTAQNNSESTGISIIGGTVSVNANTFTGNHAGLRIDSSGTGHATVSNNTFTNNTTDAISVIGSYPSFSGNTAAGNGINGILLHSVSYEDDVLEKDLPYVVPGASSYTVAAGKKVTIMPGAIIKFQQAAIIYVSGILEAKGTALNPIIFTSIHDDDCGLTAGCGNTDNASTTPTSGDWAMIRFESTSGPSQLEYATVRYGGYYFYGNKGAVQLYNDAPLTVSHATIEKNYGAGMRIEHASPAISDSLIQDHIGTPADGQFYGLFLISSSTPTIANTHLKNNDVHISNDSTSSYVDGGGNVLE